MEALRLPDLGEGLPDAEILSWHIGVGDNVVADQPLLAVETDKAIVDVPSPGAGTIARLCANPGDRVKVGEVLVEFEGQEKADTGTLVGELQQPPAAVVPTGRSRAGAATPKVRALADSLGVDIKEITGTGPGGSILSSDVEEAQGMAAGGNWQPIVGVRRAMAKRMAMAHRQVVPATITGDADVHHWPADTDINLRLVLAVAAACATEPALNAWFDMRQMARQLHSQLDLGLAVNSDEGLFVPVLRNVGSLDATRLRAEMKQLRSDVERRCISPRALAGQTITLSNFGSLGGRYAGLVVVPPQVAIIGAGRIAEQVVAKQGVAIVHRLLPLSLTFDHRAVSGAEAAIFLGAMVGALEQSTDT